jgi:hypothetical protein
VYDALAFEDADTVRLVHTRLLDAGMHKTFSFSGGKYRVTIMGDGFNVANSAKITAYTSGNLSRATTPQVGNILPPRVFRLGEQAFL